MTPDGPLTPLAPQGEEPFIFICKSLDRLRAAALTERVQGGATFEVEARLGVICKSESGRCGMGSSEGGRVRK
jgi:hypothetical protein